MCSKMCSKTEPACRGEVIYRFDIVRYFRHQGSRKWRRRRDSNPRDGSPSAPLAGVCLRPLGHVSADPFRVRAVRGQAGKPACREIGQRCCRQKPAPEASGGSAWTQSSVVPRPSPRQIRGTCVWSSAGSSRGASREQPTCPRVPPQNTVNKPAPHQIDGITAQGSRRIASSRCQAAGMG